MTSAVVEDTSVNHHYDRHFIAFNRTFVPHMDIGKKDLKIVRSCG